MKKMYSKFVAAFTAAMAAVSMCQAFPASAAESVRLMGDMDGDMRITALDAQITLTIYAEAIVGNSDNTADAENGAADIDMNGEIDATDAQNILRYYCQTLVGDQPLWAEFREVSYHDGLDYKPRSVDGGRVQNESPFSLSGMYLEIGCASGAPGETVTVPVYIAGITDLIGLQMFVTPPEGLTPVDITSTLGQDFPARTDAYDNEPCFNLSNGGLVWADAWNIAVHDGYILANYSYTIPEDAESGTVYPICLDASDTMFIAETDTEDDSTLILEPYQFTLLNGVVVVE